MARIVVECSDEQHKLFKRWAVGRGHMGNIVLELIGKEMWENGGFYFPGYEPDECPLCSHPISEHNPKPATATEPGGLECPSPEDLPY